MKKNISKKTDPSGYTLIEVLLVMVLVGGVFLGLYGLFVANMKSVTESRYEIIASNLAQEGVEIIRNIRDENIMRSAAAEEETDRPDIDDGIDSPCFPDFDADSGASSCNGAGEEIKKSRDGEIAIYGYDGEDTAFTRRCEITDKQDGSAQDREGGHTESFTVECTVTWKSFLIKGLDREVSAQAVMNNWLD